MDWNAYQSIPNPNSSVGMVSNPFQLLIDLEWFVSNVVGWDLPPQPKSARILIEIALPYTPTAT